MTANVETIGPDQTIQSAAEIMASVDCGLLPVAQDDRLVGMITDRDIAIRGIGAGLGPEATVSEVMSTDVLYCRNADDASDVIANMADVQVHRLPVVDDKKQLVGIVALSDLADDLMGETGQAISLIARQSDQHSQSV